MQFLNHVFWKIKNNLWNVSPLVSNSLSIFSHSCDEWWIQEAADLFENEDPGDVNFDSHPVFKHFMNLSRAAFLRANKCDLKDTQVFNKFFEFVVELQWQIALFCWGPQKVNAKFVFNIEFDSPTHWKGKTNCQNEEVLMMVPNQCPYTIWWYDIFLYIFLLWRNGGVKTLKIEEELFKRDPERAKRFVSAIINAYILLLFCGQRSQSQHSRQKWYFCSTV